MNHTMGPQQVAAEIEAHMGKSDHAYPAWYIGIAADPRRRLFIDHGVDERGGTWIYCNAGTDMAARSVENHFLSQGCKGGAGGGDRSTTFVYAYLITNGTRE